MVNFLYFYFIYILMSQKSEYELDSIQVCSNQISKCSISKDGKWIIILSFDGHIHFWDTINNQALFILKDCNNIAAFVLSADKKLFYNSCNSLTNDFNIYIWDLASQEKIGFLKGHSATVTNLILSHNQKFLISTSVHGEIFVWDVISHQKLFEFDKEPLKYFIGYIPSILGIDSCVIDDDDQFLLTTSEFARVLLWSIPLKKKIANLNWIHNPPWFKHGLNQDYMEQHEAELQTVACAFSHNNKWILASFGSGTILQWDRNNFIDIYQYQNPPIFSTACKFIHDDIFFITNAKNQIIIWETLTKNKIITLNDNALISDIDIYPDQTKFISVNRNGILKTWNLKKIIEEHL